MATGGRLNAAAALQPVMADHTGPRIISSTWSGVRAGSLDKVRLTFSEPIQPNTFSTLDLSRFTGPNGPLKAAAIAGVPNSGGRQFDVVFEPQTAPGTYQMVIGTNVTDQSGNPLNQDGDNQSGEVTQDTYLTSTNLGNALTFYSVGERPINDFRTTVSTIMVTQNVPISDLNVRLQLSHTQDQDLRIVLKAPWGEEVELVNSRGGTGDNFYFTTLDDQAKTSIGAGRPAFTGSFRPEQSLAPLDGHKTRGVWELDIEDRGRTGTGTLQYWSLQIGTAPEASAAGMSPTGASQAAYQATLSSQAATAVHDEDLTGHESGGAGSEEHRGPGDIVGLPVAAQSNVPSQAFISLPVLEQGGGKASLNKSGGYGVDANA